jgi:hypothetical protein
MLKARHESAHNLGSRPAGSFFGRSAQPVFFLNAAGGAGLLQRQPNTPGAATKPPPFPAIAPPTSAPTLAVPGPSQAITVCGTWNTAPDRNKHTACVSHVQFVEALTQSRDNIRAVNTPYSKAIADLYDTLLKPVTLAQHPMPNQPLKFSYTNLSLALTPTVSVTLPSFDMVLEQDMSSTRANGSVLNNTLTLNEMPPLVVRPQLDIERTIYHEAVHFLAGEVANYNRTQQAAAAPGTTITPLHSEFMSATYASFKKSFEGVVAPVFERALTTYATQLKPGEIKTKAATYAGLMWLTRLDEIIVRVEEAVYLARRAGKGFDKADLDALTQPWLQTAQYWPTLEVGEADMQTHLNSETKYIDSSIVPVIRQVQTEFLRKRP